MKYNYLEFKIFCPKRLAQPRLIKMHNLTILFRRDTMKALTTNRQNYRLILKQSFIKQQLVYAHWPPDLPKHGVHPSATWIACIRSVFFIFPGVSPSAMAFILISGISIRFSAIFVEGIFLTPSNFSGGSLHPRRFSQMTFTINFLVLPTIYRTNYSTT